MKDIREIRRVNAISLLGSVAKWKGKKSLMAKDLGVQPGYITRILVPGAAAARNIDSDFARRIEAAAGKPENWLDQDHDHLGPANGQPPTEATLRAAIPTLGRVPVVSWVIAGDWAEIEDEQQLPPEDYEYIDTQEPLTAHQAIALQVEGTSMWDPKNPDSFEPGCIIVVKSVHLREPKSGDNIVVRLENEKRATFKQLIIDGDSMYLKPLNPDLPVMRVTGDATIVGVVVEKIVRRRY